VTAQAQPPIFFSRSVLSILNFVTIWSSAANLAEFKQMKFQAGDRGEKSA
jgi:hypothetical protein